MKRKILPVLLAAAMTAGSLSPVCGAEVFSDGEETVELEPYCAPEELFSAGTDETAAEVIEEAADEAGILSADDEPVSFRVLNGPTRNVYWYGLECTEIKDLDFDGTAVEITYADGHTEKNIPEWGDYGEDDHGNDYRVTIEHEGNNLTAGEYPIKVTHGNKEFFSDKKIYIKDPAADSSMPLLGITTGESSVTRVDFRDSEEVYLRFTVPRDGDWALSDTFGYGDGNVRILDGKFRNMEGEYFSDGKYRYHFKSGETYFTYIYTYNAEKFPYADITAEYIPEVESLKVVKGPARKEVYREFMPQLPGLCFEVTYSNGKKQVICPAGSYSALNGELFQYKFNYPANEISPPKGTYDMTYTFGGKSVTFKDVKVKEIKDLPVINEKGKATAHRLANGSAYVRLNTGKYSRFIIGNSKSDATCCNAGRIFEIVPKGKATKQAMPLNSDVLLYITGDEENLADTDFDEEISFEAKPASKIAISKTDIKLSASTCAYTGKAIKPKVTISDGYFYTLKNGVDYTVTYSSNTKIGTGKITIKGKGSNYTGTVTKTFKIVLGTPKLKSAKSTKAKSVTITWNKVTGASEYRIYIKDGSKWKELGKTKGTSFVHNSANKIIPAKSGKTYTYTVKAYGKSGSKTVAGSYSKTGIKAKVK